MSSSNGKIPKGYYLKARCIEDSQIAHAPPHVREIFDWLLRNANHKDRKCGDTVIRRGQLMTTGREIREALHWKVGYRKETYKKVTYENTMKILRRWGMIATTKTARGIIITIVNYDLYQNPKNYESRSESRNESRNSAGHVPNDKQELKNGNNVNKGKKTYTSDSNEYGLAELLFNQIRLRKPDYREPNLQAWAKHVDYMIRLDHRKPERIKAVIRWCEQDDFWQDNILCTAKLRKQFDQLELKMNKEDSKHGRNGISKEEPAAHGQASTGGKGERASISGQDFGELHNSLE